jgi:SAM-dependent methyltransferase
MQHTAQRRSALPDPRQLDRHQIWNEKPTLRLLYTDYHRRLMAACPDGPLLDIGGGTAHVKQVRSDVCSIVVCDAHSLPFPADHFAGIIIIDVLHHLERPITFLKAASFVLCRGGVLAMIEPDMSPIAYPFYNYLHQEPVDMRVDPFLPGPVKSSRDPYDANQAIPTLLFRSANRPRLNELLPELTIRQVDWLSLFAFPLVGASSPGALYHRRSRVPL